MKKIGIVNSVGLNVRRRPSIRGGLITQYAKGDKVEILGTGPKGWMLIRGPRGKEGYAYGAYIDIEPELPPLPANRPFPVEEISLPRPIPGLIERLRLWWRGK